MQIIENPYLVRMVWLHRPRSRKRRIIEKWKRRSGNVRWHPITAVFQMSDDVLICHPSVAAELRRKAKEIGL